MEKAGVNGEREKRKLQALQFDHSFCVELHLPVWGRSEQLQNSWNSSKPEGKVRNALGSHTLLNTGNTGQFDGIDSSTIDWSPLPKPTPKPLTGAYLDICGGLLRDLLHSTSYKEPQLNLQALKQEKTEILPFFFNSILYCLLLWKKCPSTAWFFWLASFRTMFSCLSLWLACCRYLMWHASSWKITGKNEVKQHVVVYMWEQ